MKEYNKAEIDQAYVLARRVAEKVAKNNPVVQMDIEDMVQDAMLGWLEGQNMGHAIMDSLRSRFGQEFRKGEARPLPLPYTEDEAGAGVGEDPTETVEAKLAISRAIEQCITDPTTRLIIWLYYFEDKTTREIAGIVDLSKSRVDQLKHEALSQLKEALS